MSRWKKVHISLGINSTQEAAAAAPSLYLFLSSAVAGNVTSQTCEEEEEEDPGEFGREILDTHKTWGAPRFQRFPLRPWKKRRSAGGWVLSLVTYHYFVYSHLSVYVLLILSAVAPHAPYAASRNPPASCQNWSLTDSCGSGGGCWFPLRQHISEIFCKQNVTLWRHLLNHHPIQTRFSLRLAI